MAYATHSDVSAELKGAPSFSSSTSPTDTQVGTWCTRASRMIDGQIGGKYSTPVDSGTSPIAYSMLQEICIWIVLSKLSTILNLPTGEDKTTNKTGGLSYWDKAITVLKQIREGEVILSDATLASSTDGVEAYTDDNSSTLQPPTFTKEGTEW